MKHARLFCFIRISVWVKAIRPLYHPMRFLNHQSSSVSMIALFSEVAIDKDRTISLK